MAVFQVADLITDVLELLGEVDANGNNDYTYFSENFLKRKLLESYKSVAKDSLSVFTIEDINGITGKAYLESTDYTPLMVSFLSEGGSVLSERVDKSPSNLNDGEYCLYNGRIYIEPAPTDSDVYTLNYIGYKKYTASSTSIELDDSLKEALLNKMLFFCSVFDGKADMAAMYDNLYKGDIKKNKKFKRNRLKYKWNPEFTE